MADQEVLQEDTIPSEMLGLGAVELIGLSHYFLERGVAMLVVMLRRVVNRRDEVVPAIVWATLSFTVIVILFG